MLVSVIAGLVSYLMGALVIYKYLDVGPAHLWYHILLGRRLNKISVQQLGEARQQDTTMVLE